jgi:signal transduction histidine kinase
MKFPLPHRRRPRAALVTALLMLALGFAVVLALQAYGAVQHQKAQAERVLRDYSAFAAWRFAGRSAQSMWYFGFNPTLKALDEAVGKTGRVPRPSALPTPELPTREDSMRLQFQHQVQYLFALDTATGRLSFGGSAPSVAWQHWLTDTIARQMWDLPPKEDMAAVLGGPSGERPMLAVFTLPRAAPRPQGRVLGFLVSVEALRPMFDFVARTPLLPQVLTGGVALDSMGSVVVSDPHGMTVYRSMPQYSSMITSHDTLGSYMAGLRVSVSMRPDIAGKVVIGGLPRSRLPMLLGLFALTAGLMVTALYQLRRETELAALRTDFVSGVSHELRTPLAQIRMFAETLVLGRVRTGEERTRSLRIIDQEARRLTTLVENLLHFSRSERQTLRISPAPTLLGPVVRGVLESFSPLAETRQVRLVTSLSDGVTAWVDEGALRQMLLNLLDNAVKYGPEGQAVTVGVEPAAGDRVRVWVQDQGPGIPPSEREHIFDQFWRLERDRGSSVAGTGIGLSVVRELATLHRGRVAVEVAPGGGARFVIELPAATAPAPGARAGKSTGAAAGIPAGADT